MRNLWQTFRSWPIWGQVVTGLVVLIVLGAILGGEEAADVDGLDAAPQATEQANQEEESSVALECEPFPKSTADELISNSDTGERKIEGRILATAAVKSPETVGGNDLWFISINVAGTVVTLGHDVPPGEGVEGSGLYYSLNPVSEGATSFPSDPRGQVTETTEGFQESVGCVEP